MIGHLDTMASTKQESNNRQLKRDYAPDNSGMGISDIISIIWTNRLRFLVPVFLALIVGAILSFSSMLSNTNSNFTYTVRFNFSGVQDLKYPNGETFALQDVIAPNVISEVYQELVEGQYEVAPEQFRRAFSITSYSPSRNLIIERYQRVSANRRISFAEASETQDELEAALRSATRGAAIIGFNNRNTDLPDEVAKSALQKTVQAWSDYSVQTRGVLDVNVDVVSASFFDTQKLNGLGQINQLNAIMSMYDKLRTYVTSLSELPGAGAEIDRDTGNTVVTLRTQIDVVQGMIIDLARRWSATTTPNGPGLENLLSDGAFSSLLLNDLDPRIAYDILLDRIGDIRKNISKIRELAGGSAVKDPTRGINVADLENILNELETFKIKPVRDAVLQAGGSKNSDAVRAYYQQRIRDLERTKRANEALAKVIEQVDARYESRDGKSGATSENTNGAQGFRASTVIPQFDDGFLDRIISMSSKSDDVKFRQELAHRSIRLLEKVASLGTSIDGLKSDLQLFDKGVETEGSAIIPATSGVNAILSELEGYLQITVRIGQRIQTSNDFSRVLVNGLLLEDSDARLSRASFLRGDDIPNVKIEDILAPMREIAVISNRISEALNTSLYGSRNLATSVDQPSLMRARFITRRAFYIMAMMGFIGVLIGSILVGWKFLNFRKD